jgi:hypothetical protein
MSCNHAVQDENQSIPGEHELAMFGRLGKIKLKALFL